ncbi:MAG: NTP transferase domain-containing protein [Neomegalonema sp.]|nr:NTP transferase domain-containing protein [Neomegalonema sp.]
MSAETSIKTAVFPVAGDRSPLQPATRATPKELLPILDKPMIQLAVEEARAAGCERFVFVTRPGATHLQHYFAADPAYEATLEARYGAEVAEASRSARLSPEEAVFVEQRERRGLGDAVACAREVVGDAPFAVLLPDDVILGAPPALAQMTARWDGRGAMIAGIEVTRLQVSRYGVMRIDDTGGDIVDVTGLEEKPDSDVTASNFAITGRYILPSTIFDAIAQTPADANGAVQLTDAIARLISHTPTRALRFTGERFDCGRLGGLVRAQVAFALQREELKDDAAAYMRRALLRLDQTR